MEKTKVMIEEYSDHCPYCKKRIAGRSASQVEYNLNLHVESKHKEKKK